MVGWVGGALWPVGAVGAVGVGSFTLSSSPPLPLPLPVPLPMVRNVRGASARWFVVRGGGWPCRGEMR